MHDNTTKKLWRLKCPTVQSAKFFYALSTLGATLSAVLIEEWNKPLYAVARLWVEDRGTAVRLGHEHEDIIVSKP